MKRRPMHHAGRVFGIARTFGFSLRLSCVAKGVGAGDRLAGPIAHFASAEKPGARFCGSEKLVPIFLGDLSRRVSVNEEKVLLHSVA